MSQLKLAVTFWLLVIGNVHVSEVPLHAPAHPTKTCFCFGFAVSVTLLPAVKLPEHLWPQLMLPLTLGLLVTVPEPIVATVSEYAVLESSKAALTEVSAFSVVVQAPVPLHPPLQPVNTLPVSGVAVRLTAVPASRFTVQVAPQSMPLPLTVPVPAPVLLAESWYCRVKFALTEVSVLIVTTQSPVPLHAPLQPVNTLPGAGVAVNVTVVSASSWASQVASQAMPLPATLPEPVPTKPTVSLYRVPPNATIAIV